MTDLLQATPAAFAAQLAERAQGRAWLHRDPERGELRGSAPWLAELVSWLAEPGAGFAEHEAVFLARGPRSGALLAAFVHRTARGQAQGGLRLASYPSLAALLRDGLRLSLAMTRKNALAGLWWGGGKGIVAPPPGFEPRDLAARQLLFREVGAFVTSLRGCYVTAEDAGTSPADMAEVFRTTRFVTCIPPALGGSGNPSHATARGVVRAMEAALDGLGLGALRGKRVAMQGAGQVGGAMIELLLDAGVARVVVGEIDAARCEALRRRHAGRPLELRVAPPGRDPVLCEPCDVLAPNALGGVLGPETIGRLQARIVCGAANNPLVDETRDARALAERGIVYVPDFVCNCAGIVHCADEAAGQVQPDPRLERLLGNGEGSIFARTQEILRRAQQQRTTPLDAAQQLADRLAEAPHPLFGTRAREIVRALVREGWEAPDAEPQADAPPQLRALSGAPRDASG